MATGVCVLAACVGHTEMAACFVFVCWKWPVREVNQMCSSYRDPVLCSTDT